MTSADVIDADGTRSRLSADAVPVAGAVRRAARPGGLLLRSSALLPWSALGAAGAVVRQVDLGPPWSHAALPLAIVAVVWALALRAVAGRGWLALPAIVVLGGATALATSSTVPRDSLLVGLAGVLVADAAIARPTPSLPWHPEGAGLAVPACWALATAQAEWSELALLRTVGPLLVLGYALALAPLPGWTVLSRQGARTAAEHLRVGAADAAEGLARTSASARRGLVPVRAHARSATERSGRALRSGGARVWALGRRRTVRLLGVGVAIGAVWAVGYWRLVTVTPEIRVLGINDFPLHLDVARAFSLVPFRSNAPHLLFHAVTRGWDVLLPADLAAVAACVTFTALTYVAVVVLLEQPSRAGLVLAPTAAATLAAAYFFLETPKMVALAAGLVPSTGFVFTIHWWGNPTWLAGLPFTILVLPLLERVVAGAEAGVRDRRAERMLPVVVVLATLGKPTLTLCLIPALPFHLVLVRRAAAATVRRALLLAVLPAVVVVGWQTWFINLSAASEFSSGWVVDPIVDAPFGWTNVDLLFFLPFAPVVAALVLAGRAFLADRSVQLVLLCTAVAVPLMLTVRETGERARHGNFAVPAQGCIALLVLLAVRTLAQQAVQSWSRPQRGRRDRAVLVVAGTLLVGFLLGGVLSHLDAVGLIDIPIDWEDHVPAAVAGSGPGAAS